MNNHDISLDNKKTTATVARKEMVASRRESNRQHGNFKVNCSMVSTDNKKTTAMVARKEMVARDGIEPPTQGFSVPCSTN